MKLRYEVTECVSMLYIVSMVDIFLMLVKLLETASDVGFEEKRLVCAFVTCNLYAKECKAVC